MAQERLDVISPNTLTVFGGDGDERIVNRPPRSPSTTSSTSSRPTTGRKSAAKLSRETTSLEVLPPENEEKKKKPPKLQQQPSSRSSSLDSGSKAKSGGSRSVSRSSDKATAAETEAIERCNSTGSIDENSRPPTRQIILPTVKRNFEQHGMPRDEALAQSLISPSRSSNYEDFNGILGSYDTPSSSVNGSGKTPKKENVVKQSSKATERSQSEDGNRKIEADVINARPPSRSKNTRKERPKETVASSTTEVDSYYLIHETKQNQEKRNEREKEKEKEKKKSANERASSATTDKSRRKGAEKKEKSGSTRGTTEEVDSYYLTHASQEKGKRNEKSGTTTEEVDSYFLTHKSRDDGRDDINDEGSTANTSRDDRGEGSKQRQRKDASSKVDCKENHSLPDTALVATDAGAIPKRKDETPEAGDGKAGDGEGSESSSDEETSSSDEEEEEERRAPIELLGEFIECVMEEDWEVALKLCQMIQLYEPDNPECKEFKPLIEEMLKREREEQLWGTDDDDDDEDEEDDDDEDDSDEDSSSSSSSEEEDDDDDEEEEEEEDEDKKEEEDETTTGEASEEKDEPATEEPTKETKFEPTYMTQ